MKVGMKNEMGLRFGIVNKWKMGLSSDPHQWRKERSIE